jgi:vacuolar-type H+-ATPase subunit I/STV1
MYGKWLRFFYSPLDKIKNKKVNKEWVDETMKISADNWSITLQPSSVTDIPTILYELEEQKKEALFLMKTSIKNQDQSLFTKGEEMYNKYEKKKKEIENIIEKNKKLLDETEEKIFELRRKIYLEPKDKKLQKQLSETINSKFELEKSIDKETNNYVLKAQSIKQSGPVPEPPEFKAYQEKLSIVRKGGDIKIIRL